MIDIPEPPKRMEFLRRDHRGYPVPWFVKWYGDKPDFRVIGDHKFQRAIHNRLCWVCGHSLGRYLCFMIGPMCAINRTTSEPGCHRECALYAATTCPFLANPRVHRQGHNLPEESYTPGIQLDRNPGVACVWITRSYKLFNAGGIPGSGAGVLLELGDPTEVLWFARGQPATGQEVWHSIETGLGFLVELVRQDPDPVGAARALRQQTQRVASWVPPSDHDVDAMLDAALMAETHA